MSKSVKFNIELSIDGKTQVISASTNVKDLASNLGIAHDRTDELRKGIEDMASAGIVFQSLSKSLSDLTNAMGKLTAITAENEVNAAKLAVTMQNSMNATEEQVASIKALCDAQQQEGVIASGAQQAGAQELATYLELSDSLETLIPVMNDMVAQQYGLEASSESCASVATMLGKVMQGQTKALSRYGYTFDEAQEQILKFGTEAERAAVLAEVVGASVGGMNAKLAQTDAGQAKQMANALDDVKSAIGGVMQKIQPATQALTGFVGGLAQVGAASTGIKGLYNSTVLAAKGFKQLNAAAKAFTMTGVVGVISAVVGIMATMIIKANDAKKAVKELDAATDAYTSAAADARLEVQRDIDGLKGLTDGTDAAAAAVTELNNKYGDILGRYSTVKDWLEQLTAKQYAYAKAIGYRAQIEHLAAEQARLEIQQGVQQEDLDNTPKYKVFKGVKGEEGHSQIITSEWKAANNALAATNAELEEVNRKLAKAQQLGAAAAEDIAATTVTVTPSSSTTSTTTKTAAPLQLIENPLVGRDFENNIKYYEEQLKGCTVETEQEITKQIAYWQKLKKVHDELLATNLNAPMLPSAPLTPTGLGDALNGTDLSQITSLDTAFQNLGESTLIAADNMKAAQDALSGISSIMGSLSKIMDEESAAWAEWGMQVLQSIAQAIPSIAALTTAKQTEATANAASAATGAASSMASIPYVGPILAIAAVASVLAALANLPKFAEGGIAYGTTLGVFGEYPGASHNPEVVAPLNKLRSLLSDEGGIGGNVHFEIEGRKLVGVLNKEYNISKRR